MGTIRVAFLGVEMYRPAPVQKASSPMQDQGSVLVDPNPGPGRRESSTIRL